MRACVRVFVCVCVCVCWSWRVGEEVCPSSLTGGHRVTVQPPVCLWPHPFAGLLLLLSLALFAVNCQSLHPKPQVSYLVTFYLCLCASCLMLWAGEGQA
jgi:hypothetical protein